MILMRKRGIPGGKYLVYDLNLPLEIPLSPCWVHREHPLPMHLSGMPGDRWNESGPLSLFFHCYDALFICSTSSKILCRRDCIFCLFISNSLEKCFKKKELVFLKEFWGCMSYILQRHHFHWNFSISLYFEKHILHLVYSLDLKLFNDFSQNKTSHFFITWTFYSISCRIVVILVY